MIPRKYFNFVNMQFHKECHSGPRPGIQFSLPLDSRFRGNDRCGALHTRNYDRCIDLKVEDDILSLRSVTVRSEI